MISEVARVLNATRGVYILISNGAPAVRLEHLELPHYKWTATHTTLRTSSSCSIPNTARGGQSLTCQSRQLASMQPRLMRTFMRTL